MRVFAIGSAVEGMEHGLRPIGRKLEDGAEIVRSAIVRHAVKIARLVADQTRLRITTVVSGTEGIKHGFGRRPGAGKRHKQSERHTAEVNGFACGNF